jgi:hypothetical protein
MQERMTLSAAKAGSPLVSFMASSSSKSRGQQSHRAVYAAVGGGFIAELVESVPGGPVLREQLSWCETLAEARSAIDLPHELSSGAAFSANSIAFG